MVFVVDQFARRDDVEAGDSQLMKTVAKALRVVVEFLAQSVLPSEDATCIYGSRPVTIDYRDPKATEAQRLTYCWWASLPADEQPCAGTQWLELERLAGFLMRQGHASDSSTTHIPVILANTTAGAGEPAAIVSTLQVAKWNALSPGPVWDPVAQGIGLVDQALLDSVEAGWKAADDFRKQSGMPEAGSYLMQIADTSDGGGRLSVVEGASAGAAAAVGLIARVAERPITQHRYVTGAVVSVQGSWRDAHLTPVGPRSLIPKFDAALENCAVRAQFRFYVSPHQKAAVGLKKVECGQIWELIAASRGLVGEPTLRPVHTLGELFELMTEDAEATNVIEQYAQFIAGRWRQGPGPRREGWLPRACRPRPYIQPRISWKSTSTGNGSKATTIDGQWSEHERESNELVALFHDAGAMSKLMLLVDIVGSGKTVFSYRCQAWLSEHDAHVQRVFQSGVPLAFLFDGALEGTLRSADDLLSVMAGELMNETGCSQDVAQRAIQLAQTQGRLVLMFDSLDRVDSEQLLQALQRPVWSGVWVVVATRPDAVPARRLGPNGVFDEKEWITVSLRRWSSRQQHRRFYECNPPLVGRLRDNLRDTPDKEAEKQLKVLLPAYAAIEPLMGVPLVVELICDIAEVTPRNSDKPLVLDSLNSRYSVFSLAWERILERGSDEESVERHRSSWELILAVMAFLTLRDGQLDRTSIEEAESIALGVLRPDGNRLIANWDDAWGALKRFGPLGDNAVFEPVRHESLTFRLKDWAEYFCGMYLARWARPEDATRVSERASDPAWHWVWRSCIEFAQRKLTDSCKESLLQLFQTPPDVRGTRRNRPTELMWHALQTLAHVDEVFRGNVLDQYRQSFRAILEGPDDEEAEWAASLLPSSKLCQAVSDDKRRQQLLEGSVRIAELSCGAKSDGALTPEERVDPGYALCPPDSGHELSFVFGDYTDGTSRHEVTLSRPFLLQRTAVMRGQYRLFNPDWERNSRDGRATAAEWEAYEERLMPSGPTSHFQPATMVSYFDSYCFALWVGAELPCAVHWEFAAKKGAGTAGTPQRQGRDLRGATDVRASSADDWGIYQLVGNVWEWCANLWDPESQHLEQPLSALGGRGVDACHLSGHHGIYQDFAMRGGSYKLSRVSWERRTSGEGSQVAQDVGFRLLCRTN
ncbi:MAG: SUMF1/EgtB/PvdO family nonheme iron enzyme [Planctomycetales bacterium]|nr:SUMF1/EgtB/PvdO family nonheme iron enzyme [Planctomycetales bacterium]